MEGHNGQLSLHHHRTHHLSPARLKAMTVIHNYAITRGDSTTAAQRFTGHTLGELLTHLVAVIPLPARPRTRARKERLTMLDVAA